MDEMFTYEQLNQALLQLGFDKKVTEEYILYRKEGTKALVALPPNLAPDASLSGWHWGAARSAVVEHGIATLSEFLHLLRQPANGTTTHSGANGAGATSSVTAVPATPG